MAASPTETDDTSAPAHGAKSAAPASTAPSPRDRRVTRRGRVLSAISPAEQERLRRHEDLVAIPSGRVLWDAGDRIEFAYFPVDCIVALMLELGDGKAIEVAAIGNEGVVGLSAVMGEREAPQRAMVVRGGCAHRIPVQSLQEEFARGGSLQRQLLRYAQALVVETSYGAACNRHHTIGQQVCRLLLSRADRMRSATVDMTHEGLARALGVRREGVTQIVGQLERAGLVRGGRGRITLLNRPGLEATVCECYRAVRAAYEHLRAPTSSRDTASATRTGS